MTAYEDKYVHVSPAVKARRLKQRVYNRVYSAVDRGEIKRPSVCEMCAKKRFVVACHLNGYSEATALDVTWLCRTCRTLV